MRFRVGSADVANSERVFNHTNDGTWWITVDNMGLVTVNTVSTLNLVVSKGAGTLIASRRSMAAVRIG